VGPDQVRLDDLARNFQAVRRYLTQDHTLGSDPESAPVPEQCGPSPASNWETGHTSAA